VNILTVARDLKRRKARERRTLFVAEGVRTVEELLRSPLVVQAALTTAGLAGSPRGQALIEVLRNRAIPSLEVSDSDFLSAADTEHPQGVLAIAEIPSHTLNVRLASAARLLVLDAIQDPGNVGTLVRTGAGLGAAAVITLPGTADLWNAKAVRAAAGAHFHVPTMHVEPADLLSFLHSSDTPLWGTAADGSPVDQLEPPPRLALAVGNEGGGLTQTIRAAAQRTVALPMAHGVESLNVAVAAGILLYALRPRQA
jgi:TrmH family RNA methyltransferase